MTAATALACLPPPASTSISTKLSGGGKEGESITVSEGSGIKDQATLSGENAAKATGTIEYFVYSEKACKTLVTKAGKSEFSGGKVPASEEKKLEAGAAHYWQAVYSGDSLNKGSTSPCTEIATVKANTSLSTSLSGGGKEGAEIAVAEGTGVKDSATLSGTNASKATGTVSYSLYADKECKELVAEAGTGSVEGGKAAGSSEQKPKGGALYYWKAVYGGDSLHEGSTSTCSKEVLTVKAVTSLSTSLLGGAELGQEPAKGKEIGVAKGQMVADTATLSGTNAATATGTATYSVYADKECKEPIAEAGEVEVVGGAIPDSDEVKAEGGSLRWRVSYSGDALHEGSTSACDEVATTLAPTTLATSLVGEGKEGEDGELIVEGVQVSDTATLSGPLASEATGSVEYAVYSDFECSELVEKAGKVTVAGASVPASSKLTLEPGGTYFWQAVYSGDAKNHGSKSECGSEVVVVPPAITTMLSGEELSEPDIQVLEGAGVTDKATLHGANVAEATGTVKYNVYSDEECKELAAKAGEVSVSGGGVPQSSEQKLKAGVYYWQAEYSGDEKHPAATSSCGSEVLGVVTKTSISTLLSYGEEEAGELKVEEGAAVGEEAKLTGTNASSATGYVEFSVYADSECTELVEVAGDVSVSGGAASSDDVTLPAGTYYWQAVYSGDSLNQSATSACGSGVEVVQAPITTVLSGGEQEAEEIEVPGETAVTDTATLHGPGVAGATGTVKYAVYSDFECKSLVKEAGTVTVSGPSVPPSTKQTLAEGVYYWQAKYSGNESIPPAVSPCRRGVLRVANPPRTYAALGDSFSAGVGSGGGAGFYASYYANTRSPNEPNINICFRADQSWPALAAEKIYDGTVLQEANVFKRLPEKFIFRACNGAKLEHVWKTPLDAGQYDEAALMPGLKWFDKPLQALWLPWPGGVLTEPLVPNYAINLVTLTIGGNDTGFGTIAAKCIKGLPWPAPRYTLRDCLVAIADGEAKGLPRIAEKLPLVLERIQASAPYAKIRVPLYPDLVNSTLGRDLPVQGQNYAAGYTIDGVATIATEPPAPTGMRNMSAARAIRRLTGRLNQEISEAVDAAAAKGVPVEVIGGTAAAFAGHKLGDAEPWVNGVYADIYLPESLHPKPCGYRAMAREVLPVVAPGVELPNTC